ncbi:hypothetical protein Bbelb_344310 [Branchiostoma belcheri]|nr:hypothetical protein Bbelb_344310 [Branchiostoma belcheri]
MSQRPSASGNSVPRRGGGQVQRQPEQGRVEQVQPPNPQGQQAAPQGQQAAPQGQQAAPQGQQAAPQGQQAAPQGQQAAPQGQQAAPQGQQAAPQGQQAAPQGQQAAPQGQQAAPQGQQVAPQGQQVAPQGQQAAPHGQQAVPQGQQAARQEQATAAQATADPQPGPAAGQPQATQSVMATLLQEVQELKKQIGAMKQGRTTDDIREELVQFAGRPEAAFDPHRALALVEALVAQARREGHAKAQEYSVILDQIKPLVEEDFFKQLIVNQFGSGLVKQTLGNVAMHRIRELGVPSSLYIDDRHAGQLQIAGQKQRKREEAGYEAAQAACFIMCTVVVALGYFLGISKSQLYPVQCLEFLGMEADSVRDVAYFKHVSDTMQTIYKFFKNSPLNLASLEATGDTMH